MSNGFFKYISIVLRRLSKQKSYALINILGLSVSIASALIIVMILRFDLSFDSHHQDTDRIYRLVQHATVNGESSTDSGIPFPLRLSFKDDFTEVEEFVMVDNHDTGGLVEVEINGVSQRFDEDDEKMAYVMPDYFKIFDYQVLAGDGENPLEKPNTLVVTKSLAEKYFNNYTNALGKTLNIDNSHDFVITAVVNDPPLNTDLPFKLFMSFDTGGEDRVWDNWDGTNSGTQVFVKLKPKADAQKFQENIKGYIQGHYAEDAPVKTDLLIQPLSAMHHVTDYPIYAGRYATYEELYTLAGIAFLILITSCINFINLSTALAVRRSKEIGVRKVLGGNRFSLISQFLVETGLITFISILLALGISELSHLSLESITGFTLPSTVYDLPLLGILMVIFVFVTLSSGLYPALVISRYRPVQALKNKITEKNQSGFSLRKALIIAQIAISQVLVVAVIVVTQQVDHFLNQPMGFDSEAVVEFSIPDPEGIDLSSFRNELMALPGVNKVSFSNTGTASESSWGGFAQLTIDGERVTEGTQVKIIDAFYFDTYGLDLVAGRNLSVGNDSIRYYLVNESFVKETGFTNAEDILGETMRIWGVEGQVIGVVEDYHTISLQSGIQPVTFWSSTQKYRAAVKLTGSNWSESINSIQEIWESKNPDYIFSYQFLDDKMAQFYKNEQRLSRTFTLFAIVALFIGAIGLLGLISYMVTTKTKEIGVRKVLGAKVIQVVQLLSNDFILMVAIAFLFTIPVSWFFMNQWLQEFASRIELSIWTFAMALGFSLLITLLTVGYQSIKAAVANPIHSLRDE